MSSTLLFQTVIADPLSRQAASSFAARWIEHERDPNLNRPFSIRSAQWSALMSEADQLNPVALANQYAFALVTYTRNQGVGFHAHFSLLDDFDPGPRHRGAGNYPILRLIPSEMDLSSPVSFLSSRHLCEALLDRGFIWSERYQIDQNREDDLKLAREALFPLIEASQLSGGLAPRLPSRPPLCARSL